MMLFLWEENDVQKYKSWMQESKKDNIDEEKEDILEKKYKYYKEMEMKDIDHIQNKFSDEQEQNKNKTDG